MDQQQKDRLLLAAGAAGLLLLAGTAFRRKPYDYAGKTALVTGGSRGLGLTLARELAHQGARVAICARSRRDLHRAAEQIEALGGQVITCVCDLTVQPEVDRMVECVVEQAGGLDILINNAGTIQVGPVDSMTLRDYREAMNIHFWAPLYTTLAALPHLKRSGDGRIANITSIGGKISVPHLVPYSASKFALVGLSRGLRAELRQYGITVTTVVPGLMRTGSPRNALFKGRHREEYAWFAISDSQPLTAISAGRAARQILASVGRGDAELIITTQAKLAAKLDALFPELSSAALEWANRLLPDPGGVGTLARKGYESQSAAAPSLLSAMGDAAARRNNEV